MTSPIPAPDYPKVLSDPTSNRADRTVNNASEEAAARADGFTVLRGSTASPKAEYPKVLRNPSLRSAKDAQYSVAQPSGSFTRPDATVNNATEEAAARADGFTVVVATVGSSVSGKPSLVPAGPAITPEQAARNVVSARIDYLHVKLACAEELVLDVHAQIDAEISKMNNLPK